jgi:hypothetical protein
MLVALHRQLRCHRRQAQWMLTVLAVAAGALTAHSMVMGGAMSDHEAADATALCIAVGGALAVAGVAGFGAGRRTRRPTWLLALVAEPATAVVPVASGFLVRAGPPRLQVFRL